MEDGAESDVARASSEEEWEGRGEWQGGVRVEGRAREGQNAAARELAAQARLARAARGPGRAGRGHGMSTYAQKVARQRQAEQEQHGTSHGHLVVAGFENIDRTATAVALGELRTKIANNTHGIQKTWRQLDNVWSMQSQGTGDTHAVARAERTVHTATRGRDVRGGSGAARPTPRYAVLEVAAGSARCEGHTQDGEQCAQVGVPREGSVRCRGCRWRECGTGGRGPSSGACLTATGDVAPRCRALHCRLCGCAGGPGAEDTWGSVGRWPMVCA